MYDTAKSSMPGMRNTNYNCEHVSRQVKKKRGSFSSPRARKKTNCFLRRLENPFCVSPALFSFLHCSTYGYFSAEVWIIVTRLVDWCVADANIPGTHPVLILRMLLSISISMF